MGGGELFLSQGTQFPLDVFKYSSFSSYNEIPSNRNIFAFRSNLMEL